MAEPFDPETGEVHDGEILPPEDLDTTDTTDVDDWLPDGDDETSVMTDVAEPEVSIDTLMGDVRDAMLSRFRATRKPWEAMNESEQRETVEAFTMTARHLVRGAVSLMTAFEFPRAVVTLGQVTLKDRKTIEAKISCENIEEYRSVLGEHVGTDVIVLAIDSETFMASREEVRIAPDQPNLPLGD